MIGAPPLLALVSLRRVQVLLAAVLWSAVTVSASAAQIGLAWDASPEPTVTGYYVHHGQASRSYGTKIDVGKVTTYTVPNLTNGQTYYFAVTAYNAARTESAYSNEAIAAIPAIAATTTGLASSANPSAVGAVVTFTATVAGNAPTGTVDIRADGASIAGCGATPLTGSGNIRTAACSTGALAVGTHSVVAAYGGNSTNAGSTSAVLTQSVITATAVPTFADVPADHWAFAAIEAVGYHAISIGCASSPKRFCPEGLVSRAEMAVFIERAIRGIGYVYSPTGTRFADVPISYWAVGPIEQLHTDGISAGCASSPFRYCPEIDVTRAEMAVFLLRARLGATYNPGAASGSVFADVPAWHWAAAWIERFQQLGYTSGCAASPARYCPDAPVSRAEMAVFLQRVFALAAPLP